MATLNIPESLCSIKKNSLMLRLVNNFSTIIVFGDVVIGAGLYLALMLVLVKYYDVVHYFVGWFIVPSTMLGCSFISIKGYSFNTDMKSTNYIAWHSAVSFISFLLTLILTYLLRSVSTSLYSTHFVTMVFFIMFTVASLGLRLLLYRMVQAFLPQRRIILIGSVPMVDHAAATLERLSERRSLTRIISMAAGRPDGEALALALKGINNISNSCDAVILCIPHYALDHHLAIMITMAQYTRFYVINKYTELYYACVVMDHQQGHQAFDATLSPSPYGQLFKTVADRITALLALIIVCPLLALIAVMVRLDSPGPVLLSQLRAGQFAKPFRLYKFRTMNFKESGILKENGDWGMYTIENDPRVTRFGRYLRRFHLDELPQLFNVLCGDLSMIGPRPELIELARIYEEQIPFYRLRYFIRPGITGLSQLHVMYGRCIQDARHKLEYDIYYARYQTVFLDFKIFLETILAMLSSKGS